jgi:hypothetical protein
MAMDDRFRGMTVNERLFEAGLLEEWDKAAHARDASAMAAVLVRVAITSEEAKQIVATVLANPERYGF